MEDKEERDEVREALLDLPPRDWINHDLGRTDEGRTGRDIRAQLGSKKGYHLKHDRIPPILLLLTPSRQQGSSHPKSTTGLFQGKPTAP